VFLYAWYKAVDVFQPPCRARDEAEAPKSLDLLRKEATTWHDGHSSKPGKWAVFGKYEDPRDARIRLHASRCLDIHACELLPHSITGHGYRLREDMIELTD
jgi:hypothetical protein